jgi:hypothetical protein
MRTGGRVVRLTGGEPPIANSKSRDRSTANRIHFSVKGALLSVLLKALRLICGTPFSTAHRLGFPSELMKIEVHRTLREIEITPLHRGAIEIEWRKSFISGPSRSNPAFKQGRVDNANQLLMSQQRHCPQLALALASIL